MRLAARGRRDMDTGAEAIEDGDELRRVRRQALRVHLKSFIAALVLTGVLLVAFGCGRPDAKRLHGPHVPAG